MIHSHQTVIGTRLRLCVLLVILFGFLHLKLDFNPYPVGSFAKDGAYYYQVARHLIEGDGFVTSVSLYNQGLPYLPHPAPIYPLWPLTLGLLGSFTGLDLASHLGPEFFYFLALILLYLLANTLAQTLGGTGELFPERHIPLDVGHCAILIFGFNPVFFTYTSLPFTESLAFTLLFATLLAVHQTTKTHLHLWAALAGLFAGLAYLTRSQFLGMVCTVPFIFFLASLRETRFFTAGCVSSVTATLCVFFWTMYLSHSFSSFTPYMLVDHTQHQETKALAKYQLLVQTGTIWDFLKDRLTGFFVAFDAYSPKSYSASFGLSVYMFLFPLLSLTLRPKHCMLLLKRLARPQGLVLLGTISGTTLCLLPVHLLHADRYGEWFFQFRYGLPFILVILLSLVWLTTRRSPWMKGLGLLFVGISIFSSLHAVRQEIWTQDKYRGPTESEKALATWIEDLQAPPTFLTIRPWSLGAITRGTFHGVRCHESLGQMNVYIEVLRVERIITYASEQACSFFSNLNENLQIEKSFAGGPEEIIVWKVRSSDDEGDR